MRDPLFHLATVLLCACSAPQPEVAVGPAPVAAVDASSGSGMAASSSDDRQDFAYARAIGEYIKARVAQDSSSFDTLFINRHPDLPDIELPTMIENIPVRLVTPDEAEVRKNNQGFVLLNVIAWLSSDEADFIVVRFEQGIRPKHNCEMEFTYDSARGTLELDTLKFLYPYPQATAR